MYHQYHTQCYMKYAQKYGNVYDTLVYPDTTSRLKGYSSLNIKQKEYINKIMFPNLTQEHLRHQLCLTEYNLSNLSEQDLIVALQQRNIEILEEIHCNDNNNYMLLRKTKESMINRLESFLCDEKCTKKNQTLISGYCRLFTQEYNLLFPDYLMKLVLSFGPICIKK